MNSLEPHPRELAPDFEVARKLHKKHGTSYYFATRFFPLPARQATWALYAFFRVPDEIVDSLPRNSPEEIARVKLELQAWRDGWNRALESGQSSDPVLRVASHVFKRYEIPVVYSDAFLDAMTMDLETTEYADYAALEKYMFGSAACVGLMMSYVIGFVDETQRDETLRHAEQLGYAMQLTNFLRDIDEDWQERGRVYLPQDELAQFGLSNDDIAQRNFTPHFREWMKFQAARAQELYAQSQLGVENLQPHGRFAVRCAAALYGAILGKLEEQSWNPFAGRARTTKLEKVRLALKARRS
ncbi:MAG TPA: phytoene/squalene synthase family protein [Abditibacteriaceae bacterium]|jgi:phytoene synthase